MSCVPLLTFRCISSKLYQHGSSCVFSCKSCASRTTTQIAMQQPGRWNANILQSGISFASPIAHFSHRLQACVTICTCPAVAAGEDSESASSGHASVLGARAAVGPPPCRPAWAAAAYAHVSSCQQMTTSVAACVATQSPVCRQSCVLPSWCLHDEYMSHCACWCTPLELCSDFDEVNLGSAL